MLSQSMAIAGWMGGGWITISHSKDARQRNKRGKRTCPTKINGVFPRGFDLEGDKDTSAWLLKCLEDIDRYSGPCHIVIDVSSSTVTTLWELIGREIAKLERERVTNESEEWFNRRNIEELRKFYSVLEEVGRLANKRYGESGRPMPFLELRGSGQVEIHFDPEWLRLRMSEDKATVRLSPDGPT